MRLIIVIVLTITFQSKANAFTEASVASALMFESNTFYQDVGDRADGFLKIKPRLLHESGGDSLQFKTDLDLSYNKYIKYANQDYFDYNAKANLPINPYGKFGTEFFVDLKKISEPAHTDIFYLSSGTKKTALRVERNVMGGGAETFWRMSNLSLWKLTAKYQLEAYADNDHNYLNNQSIDGSLFYDYQFLPETVFFIGGSGGMQTYPNGQKNKNTPAKATEIKTDSIYVSGRAGVRGRLAERTRVDASGALLVRQYQGSSLFKNTIIFSEPVFNLRVEEQFSPKDLLIAGYDYEVNDTKFSNYVVDQTTYIGYARILGDQLLLLGRLQYTYSSYSKNFRREDQRLGGAFRVDYSAGPKMKLSGLLDLDVLNSDAIRAFDRDGYTDAPVSYEYYRVGLEVTQYF